MWKMTIGGLLVLLSVMLVFAEPQSEIVGVVEGVRNNRETAQHPYLFLTVPRGRSSAVVHGFQVIQEQNIENDADTALVADNEDYDDDEYEVEEDDNSERANDDLDESNSDDYESLNNYDEEEYDDAQGLQEPNPIALKIEDEDELGLNFDHAAALPSAVKKNNLQFLIKNTVNTKTANHDKPTHMTVTRDNAGALMVPDGVIEIEGQTVIDKKSGRAVLLVPRAALDAIPNGSVVALMERSLNSAAQTEEERANRVIVRRRRKGSRRNVRRRSGGRRRRGSKRRGSRRKNVRVVQVGGTRRRGSRRGVRRRQRPLAIQG